MTRLGPCTCSRIEGAHEPARCALVTGGSELTFPVVHTTREAIIACAGGEIVPPAYLDQAHAPAGHTWPACTASESTVIGWGVTRTTRRRLRRLRELAHRIRFRLGLLIAGIDEDDYWSNW